MRRWRHYERIAILTEPPKKTAAAKIGRPTLLSKWPGQLTSRRSIASLIGCNFVRLRGKVVQSWLAPLSDFHDPVLLGGVACGECDLRTAVDLFPGE